MTLPIFICDDEPLLLSHYRQIVQNWIMINDYDMQVVLATNTADKITNYLINHQLTNSLFFLDIDLGHYLEGIELAQQIRHKNSYAQIVFITSHQELALETLKRQIAPLNYIVKDGQTEATQIKRILDGLNKTTDIDILTSSQRHLTFKIGSRQIRVNLSCIYFLETSPTPHKVILYGKDIMYEFYGKISQLEKDFPELIRVHKSFLINPNKVQAIDFKKTLNLFPRKLYLFISTLKSSHFKEPYPLVHFKIDFTHFMTFLTCLLVKLLN